MNRYDPESKLEQVRVHGFTFICSVTGPSRPDSMSLDVALNLVTLVFVSRRSGGRAASPDQTMRPEVHDVDLQAVPGRLNATFTFGSFTIFEFEK